MQIIRFTKPIKLLLIVALLGILFAYTIPWVSKNASSHEYSGLDFHAYWYAGHYTRAGVNPYWAIFREDQFPVYWDQRYPGSGVPYPDGNKEGGTESNLKLPIRYLDGHVVTKYPVAQMFIVGSGATAPLHLFEGLFSWFSWPTARAFWLGFNIVLSILVPWLGFRLVENHQKISLTDKLILALAFYNFYGLRQCLVIGQQSVICLFLVLLAILVEDRWLLAGILLGFALSKYSVGLPLFLLFLFQKRTRIVITSLVVQLVGVLLLIPLAHGSIFETARVYLKVLDANYWQEGVHLLARFPENHLAGHLLTLVVLVALAYLVGNIFIRSKGHDIVNRAMQLNILSLLTSGLFLAAYHRIHDMPFALFFFLPLMTISTGDWNNLPRGDIIINSVYYVVMAMLIYPTFPGQLVSRLVPDGVISNHISENTVSTIALLLMFLLASWLLFKINVESKHIHVFDKSIA